MVEEVLWRFLGCVDPSVDPERRQGVWLGTTSEWVVRGLRGSWCAPWFGQNTQRCGYISVGLPDDTPIRGVHPEGHRPRGVSLLPN